MMTISIIIPLLSFITTLVATPYLIKYLKRTGLVVKDQNKKEKPLVPLSGGIAVMAGVFIGLMAYIFIRTFGYNDSSNLLNLFAAIVTILLITFIGFIDDSIIKKSKDASAGLKQWQKPLLTLVAAIPLMAINAGDTTMALPFIGLVNFGIIYPLIFVPIFVIVAANMVNLLAGFNGLEAGLGIVYMGMLGLYAAYNQIWVAAAISAVTFSALLAFLKFNWTPAKILPGDSLTYLLGAVLASIAIIGNMEKAVMIVAIPFAIEFFLKAKSKLKAQSFGYWENGKIKSLYGKKVYSLTHLFSRTGNFTEKQIVICLMAFEFLVSLLIWIA
jgi:UDP-N-acetylglucosamine--dolichyl-phosphate N-acetylglucosaminephosphotransferase